MKRRYAILLGSVLLCTVSVIGPASAAPDPAAGTKSAVSPAADTSAPGTASHFDNLYQTANTNWDCWDGERNDGLYCRTDNAAVYIVREPGMTDKGDQDVVNSLRSEYSPTDLAIHVVSKGVYEGSGETDIVYDYHEYPGATKGVAWCNDATSDYECDQHYVEFDDRDPTMNAVCHESGHAVGLTHGQEASPRQGQTASVLGCMRATANSAWRDLGTHNTSTINRLY